MKRETIEEVALNLIKEAAIYLPKDVKLALKKAHKRESNATAKIQLKTILANIELAEKQQTPLCQDTGTVTFYAKAGSEARNVDSLEAAIISATRKATIEVPLRPNAVDPFTQVKSGDNTGRFTPHLHLEIVKGDSLELTVLLKGAGSENVSALGMLNPGEGVKGLKKFVIDSVIKAGAQPCPPTILGVAVGGGADVAMELAKKALLGPLGRFNSEPRLARLERELLDAVNMTEIGPMGLGGDTTVLGVRVDYAHRHTASFPVAVAFSCWAERKASAQIRGDGSVKYLTKRVAK